MRSAVAKDQADVAGCERIRILALKEGRCLDDFGRDFDDIGSRGRAGGQRRFERHTAAQTDDAHLGRMVVHQHGEQSQQALRQHVAPVGCVHLSVNRQRRCAGETADAHRGRGAFFVVLESAGCERRLEVALPDIRRVFVRAACEQLTVPRRQRQHGDAERDNGHKW